MANFLETLAFGLVIGSQFLAAIVLISKLRHLYPDTRESRIDQDQPRPTGGRERVAGEQRVSEAA
jgi:hypothetical protein